jgi:transporter family-2 protein
VQSVAGWRGRAPVALGVVAGASVVVQSRVNGALQLRTHSGVAAALANFLVGLILVTIAVAVLPKSRSAARALPGRVRSKELRWWQLLGGLSGATFIAVQSVSVPALGVALFIVAVVAGQSGSSLLVDRAGLGPGGSRPISTSRLVAAGMSVVAVALAVSGRVGSMHAVVSYVLLAIVAGMLTSVQQAFNGRIASGGGSSPNVAALVNFVSGFLGLLAVTAIGMLVFGQNLSWPSPMSHPALYLGGPLGLFFIASGALVVRRVGVLLFVLSAVAGQLAGSLILDLTFPTPGTLVTWQVVTGVLLTGVAVAVAALRNN